MRLGRIAKIGDHVDLGNVEAEVIALQRRRITRLRITRKPNEKEKTEE
jgi:CBS domain containing-hemolysin-like protein